MTEAADAHVKRYAKQAHVQLLGIIGREVGGIHPSTISICHFGRSRLVMVRSCGWQTKAAAVLLTAEILEEASDQIQRSLPDRRILIVSHSAAHSPALSLRFS